jgi:probable rRNA maturation factor
MKEENDSFSITNTLKITPPIDAGFFNLMKDAALGKKYCLSVVIVGNTKIKNLNRAYRQIDKPTDILSFSVTKNEGEIFINPYIAKKKSKEFDRNEANFLQFLFIHGLCHLKGMTHGRIMEKEEEKLRKKFKV